MIIHSVSDPAYQGVTWHNQTAEWEILMNLYLKNSSFLY